MPGRYQLAEVGNALIDELAAAAAAARGPLRSPAARLAAAAVDLPFRWVGEKGAALVEIGSVSQPVTVDAARQLIALQRRQVELDLQAADGPSGLLRLRIAFEKPADR